jgi:DsbC/DsbD-like thiol-disulfide interchange protein
MKRLSALFAVLLPLLPAPGLADTTGWTEVHGGAVRLITSGPIDNGQYLAGLEFMLEPGWHTYWRYPGEAGIPPQIATEGSTNVRSLDVLYPVPERYNDGFSESIVYHDGIVLPLKITPEDPGKAVSLSLDLFFGICSDICVPGDAALTLELTPSASEDELAERLIRRDLNNVPTQAGKDGLRIRSVTMGETGDALVIEADVGEAAEADLFAAGPDGSYIALPKPSSRPTGKAAWTLSTKGLSTTDTDTMLRLVLTTGSEAIEHLEPIPSSWTQ